MKTNAQIAAEFKKRKAITIRGLSKQFKNSDKCDAYYEADFFDVTKMDRRPVQIDKVSPYVRAVNGFMIQNRPIVKYLARIPDQAQQDKYSKNANALRAFVRKNNRADQVSSQTTKNVLIKGYGITDTVMTYEEGYATTDPNGEILIGDVTDDAGWDPMARKKNLLDARWKYYRKSYAKDDAEKIFKAQEEDFQVDNTQNNQGFEFDPNIYPYDRSKTDDGYEWNSENEQSVWVYFYQWYEIEDFYRAENPLKNMSSPQAMQAAMLFMQGLADEANQEDSMFTFDPMAERLVFDSSIKTKLEEQFEDLITTFKFQRKVFYTAVLSGSKVFKAYRSVSQSGFTIKAMTGDWHNKSKIWVGMVNPMMEPALYYNKALESLMYTIDANSKGGLLYEEDATDDPARLEANYNKTNKSIKLKEGGLNKVKEKKSPFVPTGYDQIISIAGQGIADTTGFDLATILSADGQMNGVLHRQLIKQVKSTLADYFDSFESYEEEQARLYLDLFKVFVENNEGMMIDIMGEENAVEFMTLTKDAFNVQYSIQVQESLDSYEEKQEQAQVFIGMGDKLLSVNDPAAKVFYAGAIKILPLDSEYKQEMLKSLEPSEDPRITQLQQQVELLTNQQAQSQVALVNAQTALTQATAKKTEAQIDDTMASIQKKAAEITKIMEETETNIIENNLAKKVTPEKISVSI